MAPAISCIGVLGVALSSSRAMISPARWVSEDLSLL